MKFKFSSFLLNAPDTPRPTPQEAPKPLDGFDLLSYYKELYEKEVEFADRLNNKISNSLAILTIIGSGHALLISDIYPIDDPFKDFGLIVTLLCIASGLLFMRAMHCFWKAYRGFGYKYYPIKEMEENVHAVVLNPELQEELETSIIDLYKDGAITNRDINRDKNDKQYALGSAMAISFVALLILFVLWFVFLKTLV